MRNIFTLKAMHCIRPYVRKNQHIWLCQDTQKSKGPFNRRGARDVTSYTCHACFRMIALCGVLTYWHTFTHNVLCIFVSSPCEKYHCVTTFPPTNQTPSFWHTNIHQCLASCVRSRGNLLQFRLYAWLILNLQNFNVNKKFIISILHEKTYKKIKVFFIKI